MHQKTKKPQYQVFLYKAILLPQPFNSWDYGDLLYKTAVYDNPGDAMQEFNNYPATGEEWMATLQETIDGEITDEQLFASSVISEA